MSTSVVVTCSVQYTGIHHDEALWTRFGQSRPLLLLVAPLTTVGTTTHLIGIAVHVVILELLSTSGRGIRWRDFSRHLLLKVRLSMLLIPLLLIVVVSIVPLAASSASVEVAMTSSSIVAVAVALLASSAASTSATSMASSATKATVSSPLVSDVPASAALMAIVMFAFLVFLVLLIVGCGGQRQVVHMFEDIDELA